MEAERSISISSLATSRSRVRPAASFVTQKESNSMSCRNTISGFCFFRSEIARPVSDGCRNSFAPLSAAAAKWNLSLTSCSKSKRSAAEGRTKKLIAERPKFESRPRTKVSRVEAQILRLDFFQDIQIFAAMKSLNFFLVATFVVVVATFSGVASMPLNKDSDLEDGEIVFPAPTTTSSSSETTHRSDVRPTTSTTASPVSELLNAIFRQTIYSRIESLLLDPGKKSDEKQKLVDSAVSNYHRQKMFGSADDSDDVENVTKDDTDITKSTGQSAVEYDSHSIKLFN